MNGEDHDSFSNNKKVAATSSSSSSSSSNSEKKGMEITVSDPQKQGGLCSLLREKIIIMCAPEIAFEKTNDFETIHRHRPRRRRHLRVRLIQDPHEGVW